jgi:hypothetical protein
VTGQALLVAPGRPGAHATIAGALLAATDGTLIELAAGTYTEELVITAAVTLAAAGAPGSVRIHATGGSAIAVEARSDITVRLSGLAVSGEDPGAPVIDVRGGAAEFDGCQVSGRAWAAVLAQDEGTVSLRGCEVGNDDGAGIVIASASGNLVSDTVVRDVASSGIVVAGDGRLALLRVRLERPGGNGIIVNGDARVVAEDAWVTGSVRPAVAVEEGAGADLTRLAVTTDTGPGAYLAGQGEITLTGCSFLVRDASQPAVLVADGAAARCAGLTVTGGTAGVRVDDGAVLTLVDSDVSADGDGIQVLDGGTLTATRSRVNGTGGRGLSVAPSGHADVTSCDIDGDGDSGDVSDRGAPAEPKPDLAAELESSLSVRLIDDLVGLDSVRAAVSGRLTDLVRQRASGQPFTTEANLALAGSAGSGRRAVAELYARALAELGFLRTGALDWAPLADFPTRWPGQADRYLDWLLTRSYGGLLLLEADSVFWRWPADQRTRVLSALPGAVRRFPDAVIALSCEPDLLSAALGDVPELAGCFPAHVRFDPYAPAELAELTVRRLAARGCAIGDGVRAALTGYFRQAEQAAVDSDPIGAWDAHRLAAYLSDRAPGPEITPADVFSAMRGELAGIPTEAAR